MDRHEELEIGDARSIVLEAARPCGHEPVEIDAALGRVLAEDVVAGGELPAFDSSAMDGFAVRAADVSAAVGAGTVRLRVVDESRAGSPARRALQAGEAIAISTGAVLPAGADAVVRIERTRPRDGTVEVLERVAAGAEVRRAGEDVSAGATVLVRGTTIGAAEIGALAALGRARVRCARPPRLALLVTGDELSRPGEPERPGVLPDSNSHALGALARGAGAELISAARVGDERAATRAAIERAASGAEVLVICGGVSVGPHDHVRPALHELGATQAFWGLALKPGHPTWFGTLGGLPVFGLPGNPVSAMVTFALLVAPALRAMQGARPPAGPLSAVLDEGYEKRAGRAHALRCHLIAREDGWHASVTGPQGSHVISSMLAADALAIVPSGVTCLQAGARVQIEPLRGWVMGRA
jgi:molybdopterin molybdotransferase